MPAVEALLSHDIGVLSATTGIIENDTRNSQIISDTVKLLLEGRTPLILTERKDHAERLAEALKGAAKRVFLLVGSGGQKEKREKLAALQIVPVEESMVIVATGKYVGEGFDEPRLDTILLAMPISWKGTLAQYAGRLHRDYEGKQEVRIYDYVDIHIPMLERMYHKRLKGYAELGYQVKLTEGDVSPSKIYNGQDYFEVFAADISGATISALIVSPFLKQSRLRMLLPAFDRAMQSGVQIKVRTRPEDAAIPLLEHLGITVETQEELWQRYAVIDQEIVWYGDVDYLSYSSRESNALRFESADIAGEMLEIG